MNDKYNELSATVTAMHETQQIHGAKLDALANRMDDFAQDQKLTHAQLSVMDSRITALDEKLDSRFHELDSKIDSRFHELDSKIDSRFHELDSKIDHRFNELSHKIDQLTDTVKSLVEAQHSQFVR